MTDYAITCDLSGGKLAREVFYVGEKMKVTAQVQLGKVKPEHVRVQAYYGPAMNNSITTAETSDLAIESQTGPGNYVFSGLVPAAESGSYGLNIRVLPTHPHLTQDHELRLITWAR